MQIGDKTNSDMAKISKLTSVDDARKFLADFTANETLDGIEEFREARKMLMELDHANRCDAIANRAMAEKQKESDMERVALLRKLGGTK